MAYKTVYSSQEDIPEGLREFYIERNGTFRFNANDYETDEEIQNLRKALRDERDRADKAEKKLKDLPDDFDAEKWDALKHMDPEDTDKGADEALKRENERLKTKIASLESEVDEKDAVIQEKEQKDLRRQKSEAVSSALKEVGSTDKVYNETWTEMTLNKEDVEVIEGEVYVNNMPAEKWAAKQVDTELGKRFIVAPENVGGKSRNDETTTKVNGEPNPFDKENGNRTKRGQIARQDKEQATKLARQAGWNKEEMYWN